MPGLDGDDLAVLIRYDLRLDGMTLLFAGIELLLGVEAVRRTQVPQKQDAFGKGAFTEALLG